ARHRVDRVGKVLPGSGDARHLSLTAELSFGSDFARDARDLGGERVELVDHRVDRDLELEDFALHVDGDLSREIAAGHGGRHFGDVSYLRRQVGGQQVDVVGKILPRTGNTGHRSLSAESAFGSDFARDARDLRCKAVQLIHHRVERFLELKDFARHVHGDFLGKVAACDCGRHFGDVSNLRRQVAGHEVDVVGKVLPRSSDTGHLRLAAELSFGSDFARDARDFAGECVELIDHRVDGVLELENFALDVDGDFSRKVAACDGRRHFGDVSNLRRQVCGQKVDVVGKVLPRSGHARHHGLSAELSFRSDFARDARDFGSEAAQLVDHRVDGFLEQENFAADVDGDLSREVAAGDGDRDFGDVSNLRGQVRGHRVDRLGQVLPDAAYAGHLRLTAELAVGADFARDARDLRREDRQLLDHRVDDGCRAQELALEGAPVDVESHGLRQVSLGDGRDGAGDFGGRPQEIVDQRVDRALHLAPRAAALVEAGSLAGLAFLPDHLADALELLRHLLVGRDDVVERVGDLAVDAGQIAWKLDREVAAAHSLQRVEELPAVERDRQDCFPFDGAVGAGAGTTGSGSGS